jgi:formylglycine-generating enzyme required for sulfatase activity
VVLSSEYTGREDDAGARRGVVQAGGPPDKQREWLSRLAFQMHQGGQAGASLDEAGVRAILAPIFRERGEEHLIDPFVNAIRHRGNLLEERGNRFQFTHLTFQEYLAAQFLARQWTAQPPDFLARAAQDDWWREAMLLTVGSLGAPVTFEPRRAWVAALCQLDAPLPAQLSAAELAATGLGDLTEPEPVLIEMARSRLVELIQSPALAQAAPALRMRAGDALSVLGDPRDFDELVTVPAGPFLMGSTDADNTAQDREKPQHTLTLPEFKIARYPVTNAQYQRFVQATGRGWESDERERPERQNCPAVNVTWHDARAYCAWLIEVWRADGRINADEIVRLPTEAEWEKAARGTDGRLWPWSNEWDSARCNAEETGLGRTCAVGLFPNGASPYGCLDMAGNVWEWTASLWGPWEGGTAKLQFKYPYKSNDGRENLEADDNMLRVLRGGSFLNLRDLVRCACRCGRGASARGGLYGFRLGVFPVSPNSAL